MSLEHEDVLDQAPESDSTRAVEFSCDVTDDAEANTLLATKLRSALGRALPSADWRVRGEGTNVVMQSNGRMNEQVFATDVYKTVLESIQNTLSLRLSDAPKGTPEETIQGELESDETIRATVLQGISAKARNRLELFFLKIGRTKHDFIQEREKAHRRIRLAALQRDLSSLSAHMGTQQAARASVIGAKDQLAIADLAKDT